MAEQRYLMLNLIAAPSGLEDAVGEWCSRHVREVVEQVPGFRSRQAFAVDAGIGNLHPENGDTRPPYSHLAMY